MDYWSKVLKSTWDECEQNLINVPITWMTPSSINAATWTEAWKATRDYWDMAAVPGFLTHSGGISKRGRNFRYYAVWHDHTASSESLYIIEPDRCCALRFRAAYSNSHEDDNLTGSVAFSKLRRLILGYGFDIATLARSDGLLIKKTIPAPNISCAPGMAGRDKIFEHCFHVDINQAYFSGIDKKFGHLGDGAVSAAIHYLYEHRKDGTPSTRFNKSILNCSQGFMQSRYCIFTPLGEDCARGYSLAHLSRAGIVYCLDRLNEIIKIYEKKGCQLVGTNTDGAWFVPPSDHQVNLSFLKDAKGYGNEMGQFKIDHFDCTLRYKSKGAYEYIEDGRYNPVIRGQTHLDFQKPRTEWEWGDIFHKQAVVIRYIFHPMKGIILRDEEE